MKLISKLIRIPTILEKSQKSLQVDMSEKIWNRTQNRKYRNYTQLLTTRIRVSNLIDTP